MKTPIQTWILLAIIACLLWYVFYVVFYIGLTAYIIKKLK